MSKLIGRETEKDILLHALQSSDPELIAIYGRRRVGKTFLVRNVFTDSLVFELSGLHEGTLAQQLQQFDRAIKKVKNAKRYWKEPVQNWFYGFDLLCDILEPRLKKEKLVIFFDEFPWLNTRKSGFLQAFEAFWNLWASKQPNLVVVICGSAASWMIKNVINNRGGLHNRITGKIRLLPFTLAETEAYCQSRKINLDRYQLLQLYMVMGGIPQYLKEINPGDSATQNIDRICFTKDGLLHDEFENLYRSLFENADHHIAVIKALSQKPSGLTRNEIISKTRLSTGGGTTKILEELEESGFISAMVPFQKTIREAIYRLSDEYSLFFMKFMQLSQQRPSKDTWMRLSRNQSWKSWSGYAFESICLKHIDSIKTALGIGGIDSTAAVWRYTGKKNAQGAQVDLLIDRSDKCINLCELKFSIDNFIITKSYASELERKIKVFKEQTQIKKTIFLTFITAYALAPNAHQIRLVQNQLTMDCLFH